MASTEQSSLMARRVAARRFLLREARTVMPIAGLFHGRCPCSSTSSSGASTSPTRQPLTDPKNFSEHMVPRCAHCTSNPAHVVRIRARTLACMCLLNVHTRSWCVCGCVTALRGLRWGGLCRRMFRTWRYTTTTATTCWIPPWRRRSSGETESAIY
jgi:hypothetical protein